MADLILVDGDPTRDIGDLRKVAIVITQGHWMSHEELHEEMGITPFVPSVPRVVAGKKVIAESVDGGGAGYRLRAAEYEGARAD